MTEIIDFLKKYTDGKKNLEKVEISVLQLNRIIKALEQEPCEDAISRQAVLDLCERFDGCVPYSVLSSYDMLPPVNPQPKTGHWISDDRDDFLWKCSNCNHNSGYLGNRFSKPKYNFCPNCGADMREEENAIQVQSDTD